MVDKKAEEISSEKININIKTRDIFIYDDINTEASQKIVSTLIQFSREDQTIILQDLNPELKPINIFINSPGGSVYCGLGIIDAMNSMDCDIHTHITGIAASMAGFIFMNGDYRHMQENGTIHYHNIHSGVYGTQYDLKVDIVEFKRLQKLLDVVYLKNSNLTKQQLDTWKESKTEVYISYAQAKRYKMLRE